MIAIPLVVAATLSAAAILIASAFLGGWHVRGLASADRCPCSHPWTFIDKFTGSCTGTMTEIHWTSGCRADRKTVPCKCRRHVPAGMSAPDPLDRSFAEGASTP